MSKKTEGTKDKNLTTAIEALNAYTAEHAKDNSYDVMQVKGVCDAMAWFLTGVQNGFETGESAVSDLMVDLPKIKISVEQARAILAKNICPGGE